LDALYREPTGKLASRGYVATAVSVLSNPILKLGPELNEEHIVAPILHLLERLYSALEAYLAMTSTLGRTVQGADGQASVEGVALKCRIEALMELVENCDLDVNEKSQLLAKRRQGLIALASRASPGWRGFAGSSEVPNTLKRRWRIGATMCSSVSVLSNPILKLGPELNEEHIVAPILHLLFKVFG
jgi:hypothetical protein